MSSLGLRFLYRGIETNRPAGGYILKSSALFRPQRPVSPPKKVVEELPLVFGDTAERHQAGWYLHQDRLCFSSLPAAPAYPLVNEKNEELVRTLRTFISDNDIFVLRKPHREKSAHIFTHKLDQSQLSLENTKPGSLIDLKALSAPRPTPLLERESVTMAELAYEAELPLQASTGSYEGAPSRISVCVEPNTSISRHRTNPERVGPVFLEINGLLVPRCLRGNGLHELAVHIDQKNMLLGHSLRDHRMSLLLRRRQDGFDGVLGAFNFLDRDEVLRCTENGAHRNLIDQ